MINGLWYIKDPNFGSLSWFWRCKEHPCPLSPHLGLWRMLEVPDWGLVSWSWFGYGYWSLIYLWSENKLSILILKVQITSISFKFWFGALVGAGGALLRQPFWSWFVYGLCSLIHWGLASWSWFTYGQWSLIHMPHFAETGKSYQLRLRNSSE